MICDAMEILWGYMWGRSWVFVLARTRAILELMMTIMTVIETMAVEIKAIETISVKQALLTDCKQVC